MAKARTVVTVKLCDPCFTKVLMTRTDMKAETIQKYLCPKCRTETGLGLATARMRVARHGV